MSVQRKRPDQVDPDNTNVSNSPEQSPPDFLEKTVVTRPVQAESSHLDQAFSEKTYVASATQLHRQSPKIEAPFELPPGMPPTKPISRSATDPFARKPNRANRAPIPPPVKFPPSDMSSVNSNPSIVAEVPKLPRRKVSGRSLPTVNLYAVVGVVCAIGVLYFMAPHLKSTHRSEAETVTTDDLTLNHDSTHRAEAVQVARPESQTIESVAQKFEQAFFKSQSQILPQAQ